MEKKKNSFEQRCSLIVTEKTVWQFDITITNKKKNKTIWYHHLPDLLTPSFLIYTANWHKEMFGTYTSFLFIFCMIILEAAFSVPTLIVPKIPV
jgi:hypothetical protein